MRSFIGKGTIYLQSFIQKEKIRCDLLKKRPQLMYRVLCRRVKITQFSKKRAQFINLCTAFYPEGQNLGSLEKQGTIYIIHKGENYAVI